MTRIIVLNLTLNGLYASGSSQAAPWPVTFNSPAASTALIEATAFYGNSTQTTTVGLTAVRCR
jgi:hypothetical protein